MLVVLVLSAWPTRAAADCPPVVSLEGDPALVADAQGRLARRGVLAPGESSCPVVTVTLSVCEGGIRMRVVDSMRAAEERVVSDGFVAASVIESWARQDLDEPLLRGRQPESGASLRTVSARLDPELLELQAEESTPRARRYFTVGAAVGVDVAQDASLWLDPSLRACLSFGPVCTGVVIRGRFDLGVAGDSSRFNTERNGLDALVTAGIPLDLGIIELTPSVGAGGGWLHSRFGGDSLTEGAVSVGYGGIRLQARLGVGIPIAALWAVSSAIQVLVSPLAHTKSRADGGALIAGESLWSIGLDFGLRYGGS